MFKLCWIVLLGGLLVLHSPALAVKRTATTSGNWNSTATWGGQSVPGCVDTIYIPAPIIVTVTVSVDLTACSPVGIIVGGALNFQTGKKLDLPSGSYVYLQPGGGLQSGGGGGNSNIISIGGSAYWSAGCTGSPPPDCGTMTGPDILCQSCALGIELVDFTANLTEGVVITTWQTASEENNDYFWVQRSKDGINWEDVNWVDGAGNSSTLLDYSAEDDSPLLGISYYRLKQVDMDGTTSYSETHVIANGDFYSDQELLVITASSQSQQNVVVYFSEPVSGDVELFIAGMNGTVIVSEKRQTEHEQWIVITLDRPLAAGIYAIRANKQIERVFFE